MIANTSAVKIILTDDDADDRSVFKDAFNDLEISNELKLFANGDELMEYLTTTENLELPQLLFLDLNMPCKSGLQCLEEIRRNKKFQNLSIAIYSTSSSENEIEKSFEGGANLYIKKPSEYVKLKKIISDVVQYNWETISRRNRAQFYYNS